MTDVLYLPLNNVPMAPMLPLMITKGCYNTVIEVMRAMFQGFSDKTADFLWGLTLNNDRAWFQAHKDAFEADLNQPFKALAAETLERMQARHPDADYGLHVARIYRDARRLYGRGPFKENLWFTIHRGDKLPGAPTYWFELDGKSWSYGIGAWDSTAEHAAAWRAAIEADPARLEAIIDAIAARGDYRLWGEVYRRPKGDVGEKLNPWYNRKHISVGWEHPFGGDLFSPALPDIVAEGFELLTPLYEMKLALFQRVEAEQAALRALSRSGDKAPKWDF